MNGKLWSTLLVIFLFFTIAGSAIDASSGGINTTQLDGDLTSIATIVTVDSTAGFTVDTSVFNNYIQIDNEYVYYTWLDATHFGRIANPCTRGYTPVDRPPSPAISHLSRTKVMSPESSILNNVLGFSITSMSTSSGKLDMPMIFWNAITITLPKLVLADFSMYDRPPLVYLRFIHQIISLGVFLPLAFQIVIAGIGAVTNFFRFLSP